MPRQEKPTFETENEVFPTRLRELMEAEGVTQAQLGKEIGVRRQTISLYTTGQSKPDWKQISKICCALKCSSDYLLGLSNFRSMDDKARVSKLYDELSDLLGCLFDERDQERVQKAIFQMIDGFKFATCCGYHDYTHFEAATLNITLAMKSIAACLAYINKKNMSGTSREVEADLALKLSAILEDANNSILKSSSHLSAKFRERIMSSFPNVWDVNQVSFRYANEIERLLIDDGITLD